MGKYLFQASYTQAGLAGLLKEGGTKRQAALAETVASAGGTLESLYYAFGKSDLYITADLPDGRHRHRRFAEHRRRGCAQRQHHRARLAGDGGRGDRQGGVLPGPREPDPRASAWCGGPAGVSASCGREHNPAAERFRAARLPLFTESAN